MGRVEIARGKRKKGGGGGEEKAPFDLPHFLLSFGVSKWRLCEQKLLCAQRKGLHCKL